MASKWCSPEHAWKMLTDDYEDLQTNYNRADLGEARWKAYGAAEWPRGIQFNLLREVTRKMAMTYLPPVSRAFRSPGGGLVGEDALRILGPSLQKALSRAEEIAIAIGAGAIVAIPQPTTSRIPLQIEAVPLHRCQAGYDEGCMNLRTLRVDVGPLHLSRAIHFDLAKRSFSDSAGIYGDGLQYPFYGEDGMPTIPAAAIRSFSMPQEGSGAHDLELATLEAGALLAHQRYKITTSKKIVTLSGDSGEVLAADNSLVDERRPYRLPADTGAQVLDLEQDPRKLEGMLNRIIEKVNSPRGLEVLHAKAEASAQSAMAIRLKMETLRRAFSNVKADMQALEYDTLIAVRTAWNACFRYPSLQAIMRNYKPIPLDAEPEVILGDPFEEPKTRPDISAGERIKYGISSPAQIILEMDQSVKTIDEAERIQRENMKTRTLNKVLQEVSAKELMEIGLTNILEVVREVHPEVETDEQAQKKIEEQKEIYKKLHPSQTSRYARPVTGI